MNSFTGDEHYPAVVEMIKTMGIEGTDDYLKQELTDISKNVAYMREKIAIMQEAYEKETNNDTSMHLKHDFEDMMERLNKLLKKLETVDNRYICYDEYLRRKKI